jgi:hypothetical protein
MKPTIGIITINYKRQKVLELWAAGISRLRKETDTFIPAVVVSDAEDKPTCDKYNIVHIEQENKPVTAKWNRAMSYMRSIGVDYVMILGSDNLISTDTYNRIYAEADKGYGLIGVDSIWFYALDGMHKGKMVRYEKLQRIMGVAKTISSRVLEQVNWKPWSYDRNWGMDAIASDTIKPFVKSTKILSNTEVFDMKNSNIQINRFKMWFDKVKVKEDPLKLFSVISSEEKQIIESI